MNSRKQTLMVLVSFILCHHLQFSNGRQLPNLGTANDVDLQHMAQLVENSQHLPLPPASTQRVQFGDGRRVASEAVGQHPTSTADVGGGKSYKSGHIIEKRRQLRRQKSAVSARLQGGMSPSGHSPGVGN